MTRVTAGAVRDARPPEGLVRAMNPIVRAVLRSPLGRRIDALALIEHTGRRTGERRSVVAAWHELDGHGFVVTPAGWRANFTGGAPATVRHLGHTRTMTGTLVDDSAAVAETLRRLFEAGHPPRTVGLAVDAGHPIDAADVTSVRRAIVWFEPGPGATT
jgi:hypothetical protein